MLICTIIFVLPIIGNYIGKGLPGDYLLQKQRALYIYGGQRSIWQGDANCAKPNKDLGYSPKLGECKFENYEFTTRNSYSENGWIKA